MANTDVWEDLLHEISKPGCELLCVKVPSRVDVPGNEEADQLSNMGRMSHPNYPIKATAAFRVIHTTPTPRIKRQKTCPVDTLSDGTPMLPRTLDFSYFATLSPEPVTIPLHDTHPMWHERGLMAMPEATSDGGHSDYSCSTERSCDEHHDGSYIN